MFFLELVTVTMLLPIPTSSLEHKTTLRTTSESLPDNNNMRKTMSTSSEALALYTDQNISVFNGNVSIDNVMKSTTDQFGERGYSELIAVVISLITCVPTTTLFFYIWLQWYRHRKRRKIIKPARDVEDAWDTEENGEAYEMRGCNRDDAAEAGLRKDEAGEGDEANPGQGNGEAVYLQIGMFKGASLRYSVTLSGNI